MAVPELEPELGPEVEIVAKAVPNFGALAVLIVCAGIVLCVDAICRAFFGTLKGALGWIPYLGQVITSPIRSIEHKVVSFLAGVEHDIDAAIAHNIHVIARLADQLWHTLELLAANIVLLGALGTAAAVHFLIHPLEQWVRGVIHKIEEEIQHIERVFIRQGAHVTHVINHNVFTRIKGAEVSINRIIEHELKPIREIAHDAEEIAVRTEKKLKPLYRAISQTGFLALLVAALGDLAVNALKCSEFGNLFKKWKCSLWNLLDSLLGLVVSALALESVCVWLKFLEDAFGALVGPVVHLLTEVPLGDCEKPPDSWVRLNVAAGPRPPQQTLGTFPS